MSKKSYARRYARAIFEIALEAKDFERWESDLEKINSIVQDEVFRAFLENPKHTLETKSSLLIEQLNNVNPLAINVVKLLIAKGGLKIFGDIIGEYHRLVDNYHGIEHAEVFTAVPLEEELKSGITESLSALTEKKIAIEAEVDPDMIGGLIVKVNDKLLDGSTRSKLEALRRDMAGGRW